VTSVALSLADEARNVDLNLLWTGRQVHPISGNFRDLLQGLAAPDSAVDFLLIGCAVYAADKAVRRDATPDAWTRTIELHIPQLDPDRYNTEQIRRLLVHVTGDKWDVHTYAVDPKHLQFQAGGDAQLPTIEAVALFSGGLDSFAHLASATTPTLFVSHTQRSELNRLQQDLFEHNALTGSQLRQFSYLVNRRAPLPPPPIDLENSTRSRSLLFFGAAVAAAAGLGLNTVTVPENGFVSLNPPLVAARRGTLTTRTTHPATIHAVNALIQRGGVDVTLVNPFMLLTKGDVTQVALDAAPTAATISTVSCSRPNSRTGGPIHFGNCGYCFPCLVRRAGILATGTRDTTPYREDPRRDVRFTWDGPGDDFRAVVARARTPFTVSDLRITAALPPTVTYPQALEVIERARRELEAMISSGMTRQVRQALNW
jgi:hypothetical protein